MSLDPKRAERQTESAHGAGKTSRPRVPSCCRFSPTLFAIDVENG